MRSNNDFLIWLISLEAVIQFYSNVTANSPKFVDRKRLTGWERLVNMQTIIYRTVFYIQNSDEASNPPKEVGL